VYLENYRDINTYVSPHQRRDHRGVSCYKIQMSTNWVPDDKKLYLFDVDGVLIKATEHFNTRYEKEIGEPGLMTTFFKGVFQECLVGQADLKEEVAKRLRDWKWEGDVDAFLQHWFSAESAINYETVDIIKDLRSRGKICYLITNQEKYRSEYLTEKLDVDALVDGFFSSSELGVKKPSKEFYTTVLERIGYTGEAKDVFYVDDDMKNIDSARQIGFDTFYYKA